MHYPSISSESPNNVCGFFSPFFSEPVSFEDGQPIVLEDGSMVYIQNAPKGKIFPFRGSWSRKC